MQVTHILQSANLLPHRQPALDITILHTHKHHSPIADHSIYPMIIRRETPQLHILRIPNLLRIAVAPFERDFAVGVRVDQDVERAVAV